MSTFNQGHVYIYSLSKSVLILHLMCNTLMITCGCGPNAKGRVDSESSRLGFVPYVGWVLEVHGLFNLNFTSFWSFFSVRIKLLILGAYWSKQIPLLCGK